MGPLFLLLSSLAAAFLPEGFPSYTSGIKPDSKGQLANPRVHRFVGDKSPCYPALDTQSKAMQFVQTRLDQVQEIHSTDLVPGELNLNSQDKN